MSNLILHPDFAELTTFQMTQTPARRVSFQFDVSGTEQSGVSYVNVTLADGQTVEAAARAAAKKVCKRAGATEARLWRVTTPVSGR